MINEKEIIKKKERSYLAMFRINRPCKIYKARTAHAELGPYSFIFISRKIVVFFPTVTSVTITSIIIFIIIFITIFIISFIVIIVIIIIIIYIIDTFVVVVVSVVRVLCVGSFRRWRHHYFIYHFLSTKKKIEKNE